MKSNKPTLQPINARVFTPDMQRLACKIYSETGSRVAAADACGVSLRTVVRHLRADPMFREAMEHAKAMIVHRLEKEAMRRGVEGVTQSKPGPGGIFYDETKYDTALLIHMLKKLDPEKHGDKTIVEHKQDQAESIGLENLSPENLILVEQILKSQLKPADVIVEVTDPKP